jgi:hypothetical protein
MTLAFACVIVLSRAFRLSTVGRWDDYSHAGIDFARFRSAFRLIALRRVAISGFTPLGDGSPCNLHAGMDLATCDASTHEDRARVRAARTLQVANPMPSPE